jgi:signal peptidase I
MLPRLEDRDRLFINKFVYHVSAIGRGDVVVFSTRAILKRAISSASLAFLATASSSTAARSGSTAYFCTRLMSRSCIATAAPWPNLSFRLKPTS